MAKSVYIETSIVSYLTARPSRDVRAAAWQQITSQWWEDVRPEYDLYISELVIVEASAGNPEAADRRLEALEGIAELSIDEEVKELADELILKGGFPPGAEADALHVAVAAVHRIDYLLTWNFRHIDNAAKKPIIRSICIAAGYPYPEICTPMELLQEDKDNAQR
ncbi:type II toxin-antitoxin system VapC family toxin [Desulfoferrobacter suflitae]|uniref:type II toxin-antitoxin system VapC family toxin n=1 Tax=Desulfoferrobacter suflitae TaxID=2865782 RepID=UPI002163FFD8|nr:type II toxin-antitoxin system VapC family toxin [Desulfoferrobacter suflitae]MCK8604437.1 type II toxin-antitoxin system VapC family toxin [Desulfoferrobacter suflitae]